MSEKIPATVITGFLGAGKTSLIRHLIENSDGKKLALIINEFGDLGVDGELLKGCGNENCTEEDIVELANGCICCTVADDFLPTIQKILSREDRPDHIIVETSGLALPKPLVRAFGWPEVRTQVTVDGVVTVIDGPAYRDGLFAADPEAVQAQREADEMLDHDSPLEELFDDQLNCADMIILNKADLLDASEVASATEQLKGRLRPQVKMLETSHGKIDIRVLLGLGSAAEDDLASRPSVHDDADDHEHDDFESFVLDIGEVASPEFLVAKLQAAIATHDILRVKGFITVAGKDMRLVLQGVGSRLQHYFDRDWKDGETRISKLVIIGEHDMDQAAIAEMITA
ncbi:cobalamin biosynthesis protein CobW [Sneathiella chungangensis]|uniref:Cobalamin biosynthesis protein CobW n=1 Tax=Sneathiella chungangensis TaxID=1418234 RepID=A0A845MDL0_9PROT|nr:cobalamin biosynthesis protein CobW [Sneathiella chungangensis]MZR21979.1 cobalamin biosynthesis protein CobW [Sneathiella chungangensis]